MELMCNSARIHVKLESYTTSNPQHGNVDLVDNEIS